MPDRDYYLKADPKSVEIREKYVAHVARMFELTGVACCRGAAQGGGRDEDRNGLGRRSLDNVSRRNPQLLLHKYKLDDTAKLTSAIDLKKYFAPGWRAGVHRTERGCTGLF